MKTLPLAEARDRLSALVEDVVGTHESVMITRNGVPAAIVVSAEDYESVMETLALATDPVDLARIAEAEQSIAEGDVTTGDEMAELLRERGRREADRRES